MLKTVQSVPPLSLWSGQNCWLLSRNHCQGLEYPKPVKHCLFHNWLHYFLAWPRAKVTWGRSTSLLLGLFDTTKNSLPYFIGLDKSPSPHRNWIRGGGSLEDDPQTNIWEDGGRVTVFYRMAGKSQNSY